MSISVSLKVTNSQLNVVECWLDPISQLFSPPHAIEGQLHDSILSAPPAISQFLAGGGGWTFGEEGGALQWGGIASRHPYLLDCARNLSTSDKYSV